MPGWNAPQEVENVHRLCAGKPVSDDSGANISVKCFVKCAINELLLLLLIYHNLIFITEKCHYYSFC